MGVKGKRGGVKEREEGWRERHPLVLELNAQEYSGEDKNINGCCYCA
jgi:hypothetical protein